MNIIKSFEDLDVYKKAYRLSLDIHSATLAFPKMEQYALADQMRRASKSICANLAEGFAKQRASSPEFKRFIVMSIASSDEMKVWLNYSRDLSYLAQQQADERKKRIFRHRPHAARSRREVEISSSDFRFPISGFRALTFGEPRDGVPLV